MIYVSPIQFNNINNPTRKHISFKEGTTNNVTQNEAVLSLQNPNAMVKFQKDFKLSQDTDAVRGNLFKAFASKVRKVVKMVSDSKTNGYSNDLENIEQRVFLI